MPYNYAEEILITKTELEEKNILIVDLKQKVDESKTECAYQLRLKDHHNAEAIKEITDNSQVEKKKMKSEINKVFKFIIYKLTLGIFIHFQLCFSCCMIKLKT